MMTMQSEIVSWPFRATHPSPQPPDPTPPQPIPPQPIPPEPPPPPPIPPADPIKTPDTM